MTMQLKKQIQDQSQAGYMQNNEPQIADGEAGKQNRIKTHSQDGRSMVEMLGVLAIIGVLSIGGIVGYKLAMNHYQASQIAHEMNMMRTDAQIKIAQGMTKLLLGSPYDDEKHLNFNANYGVQVDFPVTITDEEGEEDGYSFTLSDIPAGVCKPLATLLDGMDDTAFLEINGDDEAAGNECSKEKNKIEVAFSAENLGVSGGGSGNLDEPEPPVTDPNSGDESQDDDPMPEKCPGNTWLSADESKCTCDDSEKTCNGGCCAGCEGGKVWDENSNDCVCPAGSEPSADGEECVCKTDTPHWNGTKCTECPTETPWDETTKQCKCANGKIWKESRKACVELVGECESNADCGPGEYCYLFNGNSCSNEFYSNKFGVGYNFAGTTNTSKCVNALDDANPGKKTGFVGSNSLMNWWSTERFCKALGRKQATRNTVRCGIDDSSSCIDTDGMLTNLRADFGSDSGSWLWLAEEYDSCSAYSVLLDDGYVYAPLRYLFNLYALCE